LNQIVELEQQASHHLAKVLRAKVSDVVTLFNGQGGEFCGRITSISKQSVNVSLYEFFESQTQSPLAIHLGVCISKGDRMDFVVQKATELGVTEITPLLGERSQIKRNKDMLEKKLRHWQQVVISACEQSGRDFVPTVNSIENSIDWFKHCDSDTKLILDPFCNSVTDTNNATKSVALAVGPEGGFSDQEVADAQICGFNGLKLGPRILRTETSPIAAITLCQAKWGDIPSL
jgi:16S rRNA (uracil1498-N3)-methyltransferase